MPRSSPASLDAPSSGSEGSGTDMGLRRAWWVWGGLLATLLLAVGLAAAPPSLPAEQRAWVMGGFRLFCHQLPERSFAVDGVPFAVCHRCFGIYAGLPLATLLWLGVAGWAAWLGRHARWVLAAALLPMAVDWGGDVLGLWTNTPASRVVTGGVFGVVAGLYLVRAVMEAARPVKPPAETA